MKKNTKKIATLLLVGLVAVGSYFVAGTYAKYTSTIAGSDTATVAKWAWEINGDTFTTAASVSSGYTFDLFDSILDTNGGSAETDVHTGLIAPGTKGQITLDITNNSEVNATYAVAFTETNASSVPIEYSLDGTTWTDDISTLDIAATNIAMDGGTATQRTVYWRWAFVGTDSSNYTSTQTDVTDTALGFAANTSAPTVQVTATVTLTQVD